VFLFENRASFAKLNQVTVSDACYQQRISANLQTNNANVKQEPDKIPKSGKLTSWGLVS
jgi:hypothetical protein